MFRTDVLPAGEYYVGDPCYVFDEEWNDVLDATGFFGLFENEQAIKDDRYSPRDEQHGVFMYKDKALCGSSTAYGDGSYNSNIGFRFDVDAGLLGAIPLELCDKDKLAETLKHDSGKIVKFDAPFSIDYKDGTIYMGHVEIYTDEDPEIGDDYEYGYDWE